MGLFKKKPDPISDRSRALEAQIAALETRIKHLNSEVQKQQSQPRVRSTVSPHTQPGSAAPLPSPAVALRVSAREPVFESIDHQKVTHLSEAETTPEHYNDLGVRKYDLAAAWRRIRNHFHGPPTPNPKLVNYLAAGTIKGLRPLRYEKRIARNRVIFFSILLSFLIWMILEMFLKQR